MKLNDELKLQKKKNLFDKFKIVKLLVTSGKINVESAWKFEFCFLSGSDCECTL